MFLVSVKWWLSATCTYDGNVEHGVNCNHAEWKASFDIWGKPERAPHKLVVTVCCTSVTCPKFYSDNIESPTLVVVVYVVRASGVSKNIQYQNRKPHMLRNTCVQCCL